MNKLLKILIFIKLIISFMISGCATTSKVQPPPYRTQKPLHKKQIHSPHQTFQEDEALKKAKELLPHESSKALVILNEISMNPTDSDTHFEAMILMGQVLQNKGRRKEALRAYSKLIHSKYDHPQKVLAYYKSAKIMESTGNIKTAIEWAQLGLSQPYISKNDQVFLHRFLYPTYVLAEKYNKALESIDFVIENSQDPETVNTAKEYAANLIRIRLDRKNLKSIVQNKNLSEHHVSALSRLGEVYFYAGLPKKATTYFDKALDLMPSGELRKKIVAMGRLSSIYGNVNRSALGVIVPLSGPQKSIGENIIRGLKIGIQSGFRGYKLIVKDSASNPETAALASDELIKKYKVFGIIGGATSTTAEAIVQVSSRYGVPTLVLTPKPGIVDQYDFTFQNALTLHSAAQKTATAIIKKNQFKKISILKPDDKFGQAYTDAFVKTLEGNNIEVINIQSYSFSERGSLNRAIKNLTHLDPEGERKEEYEEKLNTWKEENKNSRRLNPPAIEELLEPIIDFDALFIADSAKHAALIAASLIYFDIEGISFIGTHLWNSWELIKRAPEQVEGSFFVDSLPPAGQWPNNSCTRKISKSLEGKEPNLFSVLGYDSAKIFRAALKSRPSHRLDLKEALEDLGSIKGCLGNLFIGPTRIVNRSVFHLVVKDKKIIIDPSSTPDPL